MTDKLREKDDGYRGWLLNPDTGRTFRCTNSHKARRRDLVRVSGPDVDVASVTASQAVDPAEKAGADAAVQEAAETPPEQTAAETDEALDGIVTQANSTDDKEALKALGAQIGLRLTVNMNEDTMRERIQGQVKTIKAASAAAISVE